MFNGVRVLAVGGVEHEAGCFEALTVLGHLSMRAIRVAAPMSDGEFGVAVW